MTPDQPKPATSLRDYHDVPFPEGTQPKPAGEWTAETVARFATQQPGTWQSVADAHNAAIAAERESAKAWKEDWRSISERHQQELAAERSKREGIEQRLGVAFDRMVSDYQKQLAAERETLARVRRERDEAQKQLAKEWDLRQQLIDKLTKHQ